MPLCGAASRSRCAGAILAAALALAGCSAPGGDDGAAVAPAKEDAAVAPQASATVGGDGSEIVLAALSAADVEGARLEGELGCSFSTDQASPLLAAKGNVASTDRAFGVVKIGDYVEAVSAPGGFDGMLKGATFAGKGKTVRIEVTGPATGGGESPPRPATLTYDRADGAKRVFAGRWECGP